MKKFSNKETFHAFQWLNNTDEFYKQICKTVDERPKDLEPMLKNLINSILVSVQSGAGSNAAHFALEDIGNLDNINYNELVKYFLEE